MTRDAFDPSRPVEQPTPALAAWLAGVRIWDLAKLPGVLGERRSTFVIAADALLDASASDLGLLDDLAMNRGEIHVDFDTLGPRAHSPVQNDRPARLAALVEALQRRGLRVHGVFTLGQDHDDEGCFERLVEWVEAQGLGRVELRLWTPEPGSAQVRALAEVDRIRHNDLPRWDGAHVVVRPAQMSAQTLYRGWVWARRQLSSPTSLWRRRPRVRADLPTYLFDVLRDVVTPSRASVVAGV